MNQVLNLQIQLLLHQHGRKQVMEALAAAEDADLASIQNQIQSIQNRRKSKTRSPRKAGSQASGKTTRRESARVLIEAFHLEPEIRPLVRQIALAYERKEFLPELRHVRHYLAAAGRDANDLRFRTEALPEVISVLASCTRDRLEAVLANIEDTGSRNDLAVLASGILRPADSRSSQEER